jgi:hypothetical protein
MRRRQHPAVRSPECGTVSSRQTNSAAYHTHEMLSIEVNPAIDRLAMHIEQYTAAFGPGTARDRDSQRRFLARELRQQRVLSRPEVSAVPNALLRDFDEHLQDTSYLLSHISRLYRRAAVGTWPANGRRSCRRSVPQKTASGLSGDPVPFSMRRGAAMNRNSYRLSRFACSAARSKSRLSKMLTPIAASASV